ncbi:MAG: methylamine utilization protein MauG [Rhizobiales bacterium]|nr:methylamine utilization protein MauG [Hyphomicrobiales bacterium]MBO6738110.1 methylamine utilization protein MauG [Hyphomicrobiales bacterium]MBO6913583.1 methylamine utilization protein MauG [Hyphomicrobiales bacterium]MBO6955248.1 methylamine utilization protein MauG [Hyphomicrobiales bacterium]
MLAPLVALPALGFANQADVDMRRVMLGQLLFYDPILSGSQEVSCATCHHPRFGTGDGVSLSLGDGATGLGPDRRVDPDNPPEQRIPRNAPGLFNLGEPEFTVMFHDGRLEADPSLPSGIRTPLGESMAEGFDSVLAAQAMFPVLSADEMAGHYSENAIAQAVRMGHLSLPGGAWDQIAERVANVPAYRSQFDAILGEGNQITFADIGNVVADFIAFEWRATDSPYDRHLAGEYALSDAQQRGMDLFYGPAGCGTCHAGPFQTDHAFHAIAMPQLGPGKAARFESHARDDGRMRVTGASEDAFAFRTPSLRNVAHTAPYGHAGAYRTLEAVVRHHLDPVASLYAYDRSQAVLPALDGADDWRVMDDPDELAAIAEANQLEPTALTDDEVADILAFLDALTDPAALDGRLGIPESVPSGLPVDR